MSIYNTIIGGSNPAKDCTATSTDILSGKTAAVGKEIITGSMQNNGAINKTLTTQGGSFTIPEGYHDGTGIIKAIIEGLNASNIVSGTTVGGITGNATKIYMATISPTDTQTLQFTHNLGVVPRYVFGITTNNLEGTYGNSEIYMFAKTPCYDTGLLYYKTGYNNNTTGCNRCIIDNSSALFSSKSADGSSQTTIYFRAPFVVIAIP